MQRQLVENKVAIVIAVYNDRDHIERAIRAAAAQIVPDGYALDVVVVDDCSTDDTYEVAAAVCAELPIARLFQLQQNGGPSRARNEALRQSDAAWYMPLDSDDALAPDRLSKLLAIAETEQADMVADNLFVTHGDHPFAVVRPLWPSKPEGVLPLSAEFFVEHSYDMPEARSELGFLKPLISRKLLKTPDAPYVDELRFAEDYELYTRLLLDGASAVLTDGLGYYFIQRDFSSSRSQAGDEHRKVAMIDRRFLKRKDLSQAERRAIRGHLAYSKKEWASWTLIEAGRERDLGKFLSGLFISWSAPLFLVRTLVGKITDSGRSANPS
ncbi:MAG: glycosyltransferase family 2 protein [Alphaproteobacteria bacterium]|jgi:glycosyltransferase involved in cell wall biosynthesis|nr:glycosyltransferase family 2 protein [Alphaproteobacteria bacterium]